MNKPKVSVIIPLFNNGGFLEECVDSIVAQTYTNIEIIIVDDASTDDSLDVARMLEKKDQRIKVFTKKNEGPGKARMFGVKKSSGDYCMFVDSDDYLVAKAIEIALGKLLKNNADIARFNAVYFPGDRIVEPLEGFNDQTILSHAEVIKALVTSDKFSSMCFQIYSAKCLRGVGLDNNVVYCEDYLMNQKIHRRNWKVLIIDDVLYKYRINVHSTTRTINKYRLLKNLKERIYACNKTVELIQLSSLSEVDKRISRGFQIERVRTNIMTLFRGYGGESVDDVMTILKSGEFGWLKAHVSFDCLKQYLNSISFKKRIKTGTIIKAIYNKNRRCITIYSKICRLYGFIHMDSMKRARSDN